MTQQTIDVGAVANDGTGESLRNAFNAVNNNFANVWAAGPVDSQVVISNNVISTNVTNLDLILAGNGVGTITVESTVVPKIDSVYDLGSANLNFDSIYSRYYYGNGAFLTGISGGNGGSITTFSATAPVSPNVGDIWIQSTTGVQYIYFNDNTSSQWAEMEAYLSISGGSGNANVDLTSVGSDVIPSYTNSYNLGNSTNQWRDLWVSNSTIYMNSVPLTADGANLKYNGNTVLTTSSSLTYTNLSVSGNVTTGAVYTNNYYYANGAPFPQGSNSLPGTTISLKDNTISTTTLNQNLILSGNGVGNVQVNSSISPGISGVYEIGSPTAQFDSVYSSYLYGNVNATNVTVNTGGFMKLPVYTAANLRTYTGQAGWIATVSNSTSPAGKMAFWDTTNNRWSYVCDNTAV